MNDFDTYDNSYRPSMLESASRYAHDEEQRKRKEQEKKNTRDEFFNKADTISQYKNEKQEEGVKSGYIKLERPDGNLKNYNTAHLTFRDSYYATGEAPRISVPNLDGIGKSSVPVEAQLWLTGKDVATRYVVTEKGWIYAIRYKGKNEKNQWLADGEPKLLANDDQEAEFYMAMSKVNGQIIDSKDPYKNKFIGPVKG